MSLLCDGRITRLHCEDGDPETYLAGYVVGMDGARWECATPDFDVSVRASFANPRVGTVVRGGETSVVMGALCHGEQLRILAPGDPGAEVTITEFEPGARIAGTFSDARGRFVGSFDYACDQTLCEDEDHF